jgi:hypothetical protein
MFGVYRNLSADLAQLGPAPESPPPAATRPEKPVTVTEFLCLNERSQTVKVEIGRRP